LKKRDLMISVSGIRGLVFDPLSPEFVCRFAAAFASSLGTGKYVVGRDSRPSGDILKPAVVSGIRGVGCDVIDVGIVPTPTIQMAVETNRAAGGIAITASHNPAEWNALKMISGCGTFLCREDIDRVVDISTSHGIAYASSGGGGSVKEDPGAGDRHIDGILGLDHANAAGIRDHRFKVVIDCTNGAGSLVAPALLRRLGCEVTEISCEPTGLFPRNPEPVKENIGDLCRVVKQGKADVGFALDPDGDRLALVDERGIPVGEDYTLVICADLVLRKSRGPVVTNLSTSMAVEEVARRHGVGFFRTPIGEINVVEKMKEVDSTIGGEGNGGVILPALHFGRDALVGMALVLESLAQDGTTLSELVNRFPRYDIIKQKVRLVDRLDFESLRASLEGEFAGAEFNLDDGIRIDLGDMWLHVRKSGTEPVVRLISEAGGREKAQNLIARALSLLDTQGGF
jgi:phosphomannomutase